MTSKTEFKPLDSHFISQPSSIATRTSLTAYGKLIAESETNPSDVGLKHPSTTGGSLHRALIYAVRVGNQLSTLPTPQEMMMPGPDGPSQESAWPGASYVEWQGLSRNWETLHRIPIEAALLGGGTKVQAAIFASLASNAAPIALSDLCQYVVQSAPYSNRYTGEPTTATLGLLGVDGGTSAGFIRSIQKKIRPWQVEGSSISTGGNTTVRDCALSINDSMTS